MKYSLLLIVFWCVELVSSAYGHNTPKDIKFEKLTGEECVISSLITSPWRKNSNEDLNLTINDSKTYMALFYSNHVRQSCLNDFPQHITPVDFSDKTVLGMESYGSCSVIGFQRSVQEDVLKKTVTYHVEAITGSLSSCMEPGPESLNLIAVPKIPKDYKIVFQNAVH